MAGTKTRKRSSTDESANVWTDEERAAMQEHAKEVKAARGRKGKGDGEADVLAKIAEMPEADRVMAERIHAIVKAAAPGLKPRTWYGMPAYTDDAGKNVCFFQHDLVTDDVFGEMQIVFCRNVLMYFGSPLRDEVASKLSRALCPGGFLCLGKDERLPPAVVRSFTPLEGANGIYRYEGEF